MSAPIIRRLIEAIEALLGKHGDTHAVKAAAMMAVRDGWDELEAQCGS